jgi:hypothetical protein
LEARLAAAATRDVQVRKVARETDPRWMVDVAKKSDRKSIVQVSEQKVIAISNLEKEKITNFIDR